MIQLTELMKNNSVAIEYEKAFWLKQFGDICKKMDSDIKYRNRILQLYKESYDENMTTQSIIEKETGYMVSDKYVKIIAQWMKAHFRKKNSRNEIPFAVKKELFVKQIVEAVEHSLKQSLPIFLSGLTAGMLERESPIRVPFPAPEKEQPDRDIDWDFLGE